MIHKKLKNVNNVFLRDRQLTAVEIYVKEKKK
jgi:hypothetical protein